MKNNRKKVMILTNHSYMLYRFRKELIEELMKNYDVVLSMPFVGHHEDFINIVLKLRWSAEGLIRFTIFYL